MSFQMKRSDYAGLFGPTAGDSVRLGDTELFAYIEKDMTVYGQEAIFAGGKVLRDGMGMNNTELRSVNPQVVDMAITNVIIIDYTGVYKADIGIRDGKIVATGKGGNPDHMDDVDFVIGISTEAFNGDGMICTAGGIDTHVHFITPEIAIPALGNGTTTLFGGGTGIANGTRSATTSPGKYNIHTQLRAWDDIPMNIGIYAKGQGASPDLIGEQLQAGAGGGHAPDVMVVCGQDNVLPSSTNPTNPYSANVISELFYMTIVCHSLNPKVPADVAFAETRVRKQTIGAEDVLQDMGALSMMTSATQAMGRVGETIQRTWQLASKMKVQRGSLEGDTEHNDNNRIKRYVAKYTINPAITAGISDYIGSVEVGKYADLVLWQPSMFGAKCEVVFLNGNIAFCNMADPGSSLPTPQPCRMARMFGGVGKSAGDSTKFFTSNYAYEHGIKEELSLDKTVLPVRNCRNLTKRNMKLNDYQPKTIKIDPQTYVVTIDDETITCDAPDTLPLSQRYFLF